MNAFPRPVVVVSKCLGFAACRYNGECLPDVFVERMKPYVEFRPVCPEMEIGLGVPRDPIRVVLLNNELRLIQPSTGKDVTDKMRQFADSFISGVSEADGFLLKSRSPSCGINSVKVYPGLGKAGAILQKGKGFFAGVVRERLPLTPLEEEGRLYDFGIRGHYLARLFAFARFREIIRKPAMKKLVEFHNNNELLLMANHQKEMRALEKIAANHENNPLENVVAEYGAHLRLALAAPSHRAANINTLMHAFGYFSKQIPAREKTRFMQILEDYRAAKIPLSAPIKRVRSWIARFENNYLASQTFFEPYPAELMEFADSGKGRD